MKGEPSFNWGIVIGLIFGSLFMFWIINPNKSEKKQSEVKPCNCIDYKTYAYRQAKYDMYVDSIAYYCVYGKKEKALRCADSVSKYSILLNF